MKKLALIITTILLAQASFSQTVVGLRGGLVLLDGGTYFGPGASFQYAINENIVLGGNFDYHFGKSSSYLMNFEPRFDYYFNSAFNGLHAGTNISYAIAGVPAQSYSFGGVTVTTPSASNGQLAAGGLLGYTHPLTDNLLLDLSCGGSYFLDAKAFGVRPTLTLGYKFGGK